MALTEKQRVRRTVILCGHCLRNIASYRAGWRGPKFRSGKNFWRGANSAFIDVAILEWYKLFADKKGKHYWRKTVADPDSFNQALLRRLRFTQAQFDEYVESVKVLRDKFIAHLDEDNTMNVPRMRSARSSAAFLYDHLLTTPATSKWFRSDETVPAATVYEQCYKQAVREYRQAQDR